MNFLNYLSVQRIVETEPRASSLAHAPIFSLPRFPRLSLISHFDPSIVGFLTSDSHMTGTALSY